MIYKKNSYGKTVIGVFLGGKTLISGRVKNEKIEKSFSKRIDNKGSEEQIIAEVINAIKEVHNSDVTGIGIGVPGVIDLKKGIVYKVINIPSWKEVHIKDILESNFGSIVYVNNDANCFAIGELYYGKAKNYENNVGIILGAGVGAGIIINSQLYSGSNCGAGELGELPYKDFNYEYYLSDSFFEEKYGIKAEILFKRANQKDKIAIAIFEYYGYVLGDFIKTILFAFDPQIIVIGGPLSQAFKYFEKSMNEKVKKFMFKRTLKNLKIVQSSNEEIAVLGAAALYLDALNAKIT